MNPELIKEAYEYGAALALQEHCGYDARQARVGAVKLAMEKLAEGEEGLIDPYEEDMPGPQGKSRAWPALLGATGGVGGGVGGAIAAPEGQKLRGLLGAGVGGMVGGRTLGALGRGVGRAIQDRSPVHSLRSLISPSIGQILGSVVGSGAGSYGGYRALVDDNR